MKEPTLLPRKYRIDHDWNDYKYFLTWMADQWYIELTDQKFLTVQQSWDYHCSDTVRFDTAEKAFEHWKKYMEEVWVRGRK